MVVISAAPVWYLPSSGNVRVRCRRLVLTQLASSRGPRKLWNFGFGIWTVRRLGWHGGRIPRLERSNSSQFPVLGTQTREINMPVKANSKKVEGQNRKAEVAEGKKAGKQAIIDKKEVWTLSCGILQLQRTDGCFFQDAEWEKGSKGKGAKEDKEDKAAKKDAAREELRKLTLAEEASQPSKKPTLKPVKAAKPGPAKIVAPKIPDFANTDEEPTAYEASNIVSTLISSRDCR